MNRQRNTTETFRTGTNNSPVNHKISQTVLGAAQITCIAVVLMFVVSACGSSDEVSQSPAVGSQVTAVEQPPTTTVTDSTDLNLGSRALVPGLYPKHR